MSKNPTDIPPFSEVSDVRMTAATHEAGHAIMRWLRGYPATDVRVGEGDGYCAGTDKPIRHEDALLITLAGYAAESGYGIAWVGPNYPEDLAASLAWKSCDAHVDLNVARRILTDGPPWMRLSVEVQQKDGGPPLDGPMEYHTVKVALFRYFERTCDELFRECHLVEALASELAERGELSGRKVGAFIRAWRRINTSGGGSTRGEHQSMNH